MSNVTTTAPSGLGELILIWLLTRPNGEGQRSKLGVALKSLLQQRWKDEEQRQPVDDELGALERAGSIELPRRGALKLTPRGRGGAFAALGVKTLPRKLDWKSIKARYLFACAIDTPPVPLDEGKEKSDDAADRDRAAILARHHQLDLGDAPTLSQVRDALGWKAIGVKTRDPFEVVPVLTVLLNRTLGAAEPLELDKVLEQLAAKAAEAGRNGERERLDDEDAFAARVLAAARATKTGRFGDNKVFISHVFQRLADEGASVGNADSFKARLVSAHRLGLLSLSRADMVEAMAPEDVNASETAHSGATFHFVRI